MSDRERIQELIQRHGVPVGTDDPLLLALGAAPLARPTESDDE